MAKSTMWNFKNTLNRDARTFQGIVVPLRNSCTGPERRHVQKGSQKLVQAGGGLWFSSTLWEDLTEASKIWKDGNQQYLS